jgi:hypothetical protein
LPSSSSGSARRLEVPRSLRGIKPSGIRIEPSSTGLRASPAPIRTCADTHRARRGCPKRLVLRAALNLRRDRIEQAMLGERAERQLRIPGAQNLVVLLDQPRRRCGRHQAAMRRDGIDDRRSSGSQARRHHDGAQHAHRIFLEALVRIADAADQPSFRSCSPPT